jgi:hypothetical protein
MQEYRRLPDGQVFFGEHLWGESIKMQSYDNGVERDTPTMSNDCEGDRGTDTSRFKGSHLISVTNRGDSLTRVSQISSAYSMPEIMVDNWKISTYKTGTRLL